MREKLTTILGTASFIGVLTFTFYYPYKFFSWMWVLDFNGPAGWQVIYFVEESVEVPIFDRLLHFAMWLPSVAATQISLLAALYLIWLVLKQDFFEAQTITALQVAGIAAAVGATLNLLVGSIEGWFLTRFNSDEQLPIRFRFESGEMGVLLTGIGLFLLGWVIRLALQKQIENSEII